MASSSHPQHSLPPSFQLLSTSQPARPVSITPSPPTGSSSAASNSRSQQIEYHQAPPHQHSQSPFRFIALHHPQVSQSSSASSTYLDEKRPFDEVPLSSYPIASSASSHSPRCAHYDETLLSRPNPNLCVRPRRRLVLVQKLKAWTPVILYAMTSIGFLLAIAFWKDEVFQGLDDLSLWMQGQGYMGYALLFSMIVITTIPPFPLYSTLQILSGYTYGTWHGFVISYASALFGALLVFVFSRIYLRASINRWLSNSTSCKRIVRAIERKPKLLFFIRLAPYPYNVMNMIMAGSRRLTFGTYTGCTALSLLKVVVHTSIGSNIHSFASYHTVGPDGHKQGDALELDDDESGEFLNQVYTVGGIVLCVAIAVYLSFVARRAVDEELGDGDDDECMDADLEARQPFLGNVSPTLSSPSAREMAERSSQLDSRAAPASTAPSISLAAAISSTLPTERDRFTEGPWLETHL